MRKNHTIGLVSAVKQVTVVQKAGADGDSEAWLRIVFEYPLDNPSVTTELAALKGEAVRVELKAQQLEL